MAVKLPSDFARSIGESLAITPLAVETLFTVEEDKQGFFVARLKPKQFLDNMQFRTMCALVRDLGGEDYLEGAKAWKVPGPCVKKETERPSGHGMDSESSYKELGNATPAGPSGVAPPVVADDKSRPPQITMPIRALLSMPFQARVRIEDPELAELVESVRTYGLLEPVLVRPKHDGLYEIVAGERRVVAAKKAGLLEVPVTIRFLSDEEAFVLHLTENLQRKDLSEEEKSRALGELAKRTGWNAQQIADKLKMSYTWVVKYLPSEFKDEEKAKAGAIGGETKSETLQHSATRRVAEESEDSRQRIPCARCGDPIQGSPVHLEDKFYCQECYEQVEAEKVPGLLPEHARAEEPEEPEESGEKHAKEEPLLSGFEVECPECKAKLLLEHVEYPGGKHIHRIAHVQEAET
jgi:ParB/RepB/Spo0J family partition protein